MTGGLFIGLLGIWQLTGHPLRPWTGWAVAVIGLLVACFEVWNDQQLVIEATQEPSKLIVTQKVVPGFSEVRKQRFAGSSIIVTMLVSNQSSTRNSVLRYEAMIVKKDGTEEPLRLEHGQGTEGINEHDEVILYEFGVTPLNIEPFSTVQTILQFLDLKLSDYCYPYELKITVVDMFGQRFTGLARVDK